MNEQQRPLSHADCPGRYRGEAQTSQQRLSHVSALLSKDFFAPSKWLNGTPRGLRDHQEPNSRTPPLVTPTTLPRHQDHRVVPGMPSGTFYAPSVWLNDKTCLSKSSQGRTPSPEPVHNVCPAHPQHSSVVGDMSSNGFCSHSTQELAPSQPVASLQQTDLDIVNREHLPDSVRHHGPRGFSKVSSDSHFAQAMSHHGKPSAVRRDELNYFTGAPDGHASLVPSKHSFYLKDNVIGKPQNICHSEWHHQEYEGQPIPHGKITPHGFQPPLYHASPLPSEEFLKAEDWSLEDTQDIHPSKWTHREYPVTDLVLTAKINRSGCLNRITPTEQFSTSSNEHVENQSLMRDVEYPFSNAFGSPVPSQDYFASSQRDEWKPRKLCRSGWYHEDLSENLQSSGSLTSHRLPNVHKSMFLSKSPRRLLEWQGGIPRGPSSQRSHNHAALPGGPTVEVSPRNGSSESDISNFTTFDNIYRNANQDLMSFSLDPRDPFPPPKPISKPPFNERNPPVLSSSPQRRLTDFSGAYPTTTITSHSSSLDPESGIIVIGLGVEAAQEEPISPAYSTALQSRASQTLVHANILSTPPMQDLWSHAMLLFNTYELETALQQFRRLRLLIPPSIHSDGIPNSALLWANNGLIRYHLGDYYRASQDLRKACVTEPHSSIFWFLLGTMMWELDLWRRAFLHFNTAFAVFPVGVETLDYRERGLDFCLHREICRWNRMIAWYWFQWKKYGTELPEQLGFHAIVRCPGGKLFGPEPVAY
jgi:hypothetical protein